MTSQYFIGKLGRNGAVNLLISEFWTLLDGERHCLNGDASALYPLAFLIRFIRISHPSRYTNFP